MPNQQAIRFQASSALALQMHPKVQSRLCQNLGNIFFLFKDKNADPADNVSTDATRKEKNNYPSMKF